MQLGYSHVLRNTRQVGKISRQYDDVFAFYRQDARYRFFGLDVYVDKDNQGLS